jgi:hypothetical protein
MSSEIEQSQSVSNVGGKINLYSFEITCYFLAAL